MLGLTAIPEPDCRVVSFCFSGFISSFGARHQQRQSRDINSKNIGLMYVQVKFYNFNFMNPVAGL